MFCSGADALFAPASRLRRRRRSHAAAAAANSLIIAHRVQISDGECVGPGLLTSTSAPLIMNESLVVNQLAKLTEYIVNTAGNTNTKYCLILGLEPVALEEDAAAPEKIGEPVKWDSEEATTSWNASMAAKATAEDKSPKQGGRPGASTPQTAGVSSRVQSQSAFGGAGGGMQGAPSHQSPLVAARSTPIDGLNPYSNRWQIKATVTSKSEMRTFSSAKGDGSVFSLDLTDDSGEIRATAWKECADRLYSSFEVGQTYLISRGQLKMANKKFSSLNNNYEITLSFDTQVSPLSSPFDAAPFARHAIRTPTISPTHRALPRAPSHRLLPSPSRIPPTAHPRFAAAARRSSSARTSPAPSARRRTSASARSATLR